MLQFSVLGTNFRRIQRHNRIQRISINPKQHFEFVGSVLEEEKTNHSNVKNHFEFLGSVLEREETIPINPKKHLECPVSDLPNGKIICIFQYKDIQLIKSGGVEIEGLNSILAPISQMVQASPKLEQYSFIPFFSDKVSPTIDNLNALTASVQVALENSGDYVELKITEVATNRQPDSLLAALLLKIVQSESISSVDFAVVSNSTKELSSVCETLGVKTVKRDVTAGPFDQNCHLIVAKNYLNNALVVANMAASVKTGGFLLFEESSCVDDNAITGLLLISKIQTEKNTYVLLRTPQDLSLPVVINLTENNFDWVTPLKCALGQSKDKNKRILAIVQGEPCNGIIGMINCIKFESGGNNIRAVFIQDLDSPTFSPTSDPYQAEIEKDLVHNVYKDKQWGSYRHLTFENSVGKLLHGVEHAYIGSVSCGKLSGLKWIQGPLSANKAENQCNRELCHIYFSPLNFKDSVLAYDEQLSSDPLSEDSAEKNGILGLEFAGRNAKGSRVMGMVAAGALATTVLADPKFLWEVPEKWSLAEASTIPLAYSTAYYALIVKGRLRRGNSVLVHLGASSVGQAVIIIAQLMDCQIFTTVKTEVEREYLRTNFSQLPEKNIADSRDLIFEKHVMMETQGRGVDVVVNSLTGNMLLASIRCLARGGRFCELKNLDPCKIGHTNIGMSVSFKNTTFHSIQLETLFAADDEETVETKEVSRLMDEGVKNGVVKPLPIKIFSDEQIEQAICFKGVERYVGKVVLKIRDEESRKTQPVTPKMVDVVPRTYLCSEKSYVLVGGLGSIGLELIDWLTSKGATKIVVSSRNGIRQGYQSLCSRRWEKKGANVVISMSDCCTLDGTSALIEEASKLSPVGGIFNLAAVHHEAFLAELTPRDFEKVALPKIHGTKNLDEVSRKLCPQLDYFVVFSSIVSGRGGIKQAHFGFANSAMERICESRQKAGFPGVAIQWGPIDVGLGLSHIDDGNDDACARRLSIDSSFAVLDTVLQQPHPVLTATLVAEKRKKATGGADGLWWSIRKAIAKVLDIPDAGAVDVDVSLTDLGMNSISMFEIKQILEDTFGVKWSNRELRGLTFGKLQKLQRGNSG